MENKEIYKVGDVVYYYDLDRGCLKGEIISIAENCSLPINVKFSHFTATFTKEGAWRNNQTKVLSLAPYDFVNGGFTQERPLPKIEVDTLVYVKYRGNDLWRMRYFSHFDGLINMYVFCDQCKLNKAKETVIVSEWSLKNPLEQ